VSANTKWAVHPNLKRSILCDSPLHRDIAVEDHADAAIVHPVGERAQVIG